MDNRVLFLHTGGIKQRPDGSRRSLLVGDEEAGGFCNDRWRVEAAARLFQEGPRAIIVLGGPCNTDYRPGDPPVANVVAGELVERGVPRDSIVEAASPYTTYQDLAWIVAFLQGFKIAKKPFPHMQSLSNEWHIPRIAALIKHGPYLDLLRSSDVTLTLISAEDVLRQNDPGKWTHKIEKVRELSAYHRRVSQEKDGIRQIEAGTYNFFPLPGRRALLNEKCGQTILSTERVGVPHEDVDTSN
jgi:hypothetical protein